MRKYTIANSAAMNVPLLGISVEPLHFRRVLEDVAKDAGYEELTTDQVGAITAFVQGKDVFVSLPMGSETNTQYTAKALRRWQKKWRTRDRTRGIALGIAYGSILVAGNGPWGSKAARNVADNNLGGLFWGGDRFGVTDLL